MGKGDKRTRRGKIFKKSFGKVRPSKLAKPKAPAATPAATPAAPAAEPATAS